MPPTGPVYLSISADLLNREGLEAEIGEGARYRIEPPAAARAETVEAIARKLGEAAVPDADVRRRRVARRRRGRGGASWPSCSRRRCSPRGRSSRTFRTGTRSTAARTRCRRTSRRRRGSGPTAVPRRVPGRARRGRGAGVIQIGPNPVLMGRHYPLDVAAQCDVRGTLASLDPGAERLHVPTAGVGAAACESARVREHADPARGDARARARARPGRSTRPCWKRSWLWCCRATR